MTVPLLPAARACERIAALLRAIEGAPSWADCEIGDVLVALGLDTGLASTSRPADELELSLEAQGYTFLFVEGAHGLPVRDDLQDAMDEVVLERGEPTERVETLSPAGVPRMVYVWGTSSVLAFERQPGAVGNSARWKDVSEQVRLELEAQRPKAAAELAAALEDVAVVRECEEEAALDPDPRGVHPPLYVRAEATWVAPPHLEDALAKKVAAGTLSYGEARAELDAAPVHAELQGCGAPGPTSDHLLDVTCKACLAIDPWAGPAVFPAQLVQPDPAAVAAILDRPLQRPDAVTEALRAAPEIIKARHNPERIGKNGQPLGNPACFLCLEPIVPGALIRKSPGGSKRHHAECVEFLLRAHVASQRAGGQ